MDLMVWNKNREISRRVSYCYGKSLFLVILLVVVVLIIGIVRMFVGKSPKQGLRVDSTPVASVFWITNILGELGTTSYKTDAGEYTIKSYLNQTTQYASWQGKIKLPRVLTYQWNAANRTCINN